MLMRDPRCRERGSLRGATIGALAVAMIATAHARTLRAQDAQGAPAPADSIPASHTVKRGDTLWDLARLYLGDPFLWPDIYRLNTDIIQDPHWIYPGEVLKLGALARVVAVAPTSTATEPAAPLAPTPAGLAQPDSGGPTSTVFAPALVPAQDTVVVATQQVVDPPASIVRVGEYTAAPWVDQQGGPRGSGYIIQARDLPGIRSKDQSRMSLYDRVVFAPPAGDPAAEHSRYLTYRLGPMIENFGQIVIPTGVVEVVRSPRSGEAGVGRVVKMFGEVLQHQRLIPYDTSAAVVHGGPLPVSDGHAGTVRWIYGEPVLPSLQNYVVVDISRRDGVRAGDQIELYKPRHAPIDTTGLAIPELYIGRAQVLRVTPYGATAIITGQEQPKIERGTAVRVAAKMP